MLRSTKVEEEAEEKEKEDVLKSLEKKSVETLKHKRSFFVRMVSDPKLYNPKIVKGGSYISRLCPVRYI